MGNLRLLLLFFFQVKIIKQLNMETNYPKVVENLKRFLTKFILKQKWVKIKFPKMFKLKVFTNKKIKNFEFIKKKDDFRNFYKININGDYTLIVYGYLIDYKNHKIKFPK